MSTPARHIVRLIALLAWLVLLSLVPAFGRFAWASESFAACPDVPPRSDLSSPKVMRKYTPLDAETLRQQLLGSGDRATAPHGVERNHVIVRGRLDLHQTAIPVEVRLTNAIFLGPVVLARSHFARGLDISNSIFLDRVDLSHSEVTSHLIAGGARFYAPADGADLAFMKVGGPVDFSKAVFAGPVELSDAAINGSFTARAARFTEDASFERIAVMGALSVRDACFRGPVDISDASIARGFSARAAQFLRKRCTNKKNEESPCVDFSGTSIGGTADIREAVFEGGMDFSETTIGGSFLARDAQFQHPRVPTNFAYMNVRGPAGLARTAFAAGLSAEHSHFASLDLSCSSVVLAMPRLCRASYGTPVKLITSYDAPVGLNGMTYEAISAGPEEGAWEDLLSFVRRARFSAQAYSALETFFRQQGYQDRANTVLVAHQRAYRATLHPWGAPAKEFWPWVASVWGETSAYGTHTEWPIVMVALLIIIGAFFIFRPAYMELSALTKSAAGSVSPTPPSQAPALGFNPLLYSIAVFVPGFRFYDPNAWVPKPGYSRTIGRWRRVLSILGWVLIVIYVLNTAGHDLLRVFKPL